MPTPAPPAAAARFASIIDLLCRSVAARIAGGRLAGPLILLICARLRRMAARFATVAARAEAGTLRPAVARRRPARPRSAAPPPGLPRSAAWLVRLVPEAASGGSQLQYLLAEPEMAALIAAAPQTGRILRPLCRMLGVRPPAILRLPHARAAAPAAAPRTAGQLPPTASPPDTRPQPCRTSPPPRPVLLHACGPPGVTTGV